MTRAKYFKDTDLVEGWLHSYMPTGINWGDSLNFEKDILYSNGIPIAQLVREGNIVRLDPRGYSKTTILHQSLIKRLINKANKWYKSFKRGSIIKLESYNFKIKLICK